MAIFIAVNQFVVCFFVFYLIRSCRQWLLSLNCTKKQRMTNQEADLLLDKYLAGQCTPEEARCVEEAYRKLADSADTAVDGRRMEQAKSTVRAYLRQHLDGKQKPVRRINPAWWWSAAAVILFSFLGVWFFAGNTDHRVASIDDIHPGGNRAMLTLADGRTVMLDETQSGIIVGEADIVYQDGSSKIAALSESVEGGGPMTLTLNTPRGGTYQLTLPDGSKVWLNAASTIRYPVRFGDRERTVELEGEAYFEVAKEEKRPFKVLSQDQEIRVLGTEFNVSAYGEDEDTKTTLVDGTVEVVARQEAVILKPGQQATYNKQGVTVQSVDAAPYTAWKDGHFHFRRTPLAEIMKQISRWYDVEVVYEQGVPLETFSGKVKRDVSLKGVLNIFQWSTIDVHLEGRALIVRSK